MFKNIHNIRTKFGINQCHLFLALNCRPNLLKSILEHEVAQFSERQ